MVAFRSLNSCGGAGFRPWVKVAGGAVGHLRMRFNRKSQNSPGPAALASTPGV